MTNPNYNQVAGFSFSFVAAAMWGMLPVALKELLAGMDATTIVWYRFLVAGIVLFFWLVYTKKLPDVIKVASKTRWLLLIASAGLCSNYFLFAFSLNFVNGETSEAVIQLTTLFLILGGVVFYKEPFLGIQKFGTLLIAAGLLLFFNDRLSELASTENRETTGVLIVVVGAITWTCYALLQKKLLLQYSPVQILFMIYVFSIIVLLPFIVPASLFSLNLMQLGLLIFCCVNTLVAYGCFAEALNCWDASKVSAMLALAPVFTIGSLKLMVLIDPSYAFSDRLGWLSIVGAAMLIVGSALTALMPGLSKAISKPDINPRVNAN